MRSVAQNYNFSVMTSEKHKDSKSKETSEQRHIVPCNTNAICLLEGASTKAADALYEARQSILGNLSPALTQPAHNQMLSYLAPH